MQNNKKIIVKTLLVFIRKSAYYKLLYNVKDLIYNMLFKYKLRSKKEIIEVIL